MVYDLQQQQNLIPKLYCRLSTNYQLGYLKSSTIKNSSKNLFISQYFCVCLSV